MSSESEKTPKSSPDSSEFSAYSPESPGSSSGTSGPRFVSFGMKTKDWVLERFESGDAFFEALEANPVLGRSLRNRIETRAKQLMEEREAEWRKQIETEAKAAARAKGVDQGLADGKHAIAKLDAACREILTERNRLLASHQRSWADAFLHVVTRLVLPRGPEVAERMAEWLEARRIESGAQGKIRVLMPRREAEAIGKILEDRLGNQRWTIEGDSMLKTGEVRVEWEQGGVLLSPEAALQQIESWLVVMDANDEKKEAA